MKIVFGALNLPPHSTSQYRRRANAASLNPRPINVFVGAHWRLFGPSGRIRPAEAVGGRSRRGELELVAADPRAATLRPATLRPRAVLDLRSRERAQPPAMWTVWRAASQRHSMGFFHAPALLGSQRPLLRRTQPNQTAKALLLVLEGRCTRPISRLSLSSARSAASSNLGGVSRGFAVARSAVGVCQLAGDTSARGSSF